MGPAPRDKTRKVYPSLEGAKTSLWAAKMGLLYMLRLTQSLYRVLRSSLGMLTLSLSLLTIAQTKAVAAQLQRWKWKSS